MDKKPFPHRTDILKGGWGAKNKSQKVDHTVYYRVILAVEENRAKRRNLECMELEDFGIK